MVLSVFAVLVALLDVGVVIADERARSRDFVGLPASDGIADLT